MDSRITRQKNQIQELKICERSMSLQRCSCRYGAEETLLFVEDNFCCVRAAVDSARGSAASCSRESPVEVHVWNLSGAGPGPGRARVWALGCCAGPRERVVAGNILSEVTAGPGRSRARGGVDGGPAGSVRVSGPGSRDCAPGGRQVGPVC